MLVFYYLQTINSTVEIKKKTILKYHVSKKIKIIYKTKTK